MYQEHILRVGLGHEPDFAWRGGDVSRLEAFSDAALAFAMTLIVVSLDVPTSYAEMIDAMKGARTSAARSSNSTRSRYT